MIHKKLLQVLLLAGLAIFFLACDDEDSPLSSNPENTSSTSAVRVIHMSYDAPAVDVKVNDEVAISSLAYGESSGYAELPVGTVNVKVSPAGADDPVVIEADLPILENSAYTVIAVNQLSQITPIVLDDSEVINTVDNKAKVRFVHASPDAPAVDIKLNNGEGAAIFEDVSFSSYKNYIEVDGGSYNLAVTPAGSTIEVAIFGNVPLAAGGIYTVIARGTLDASDEYDFEVRAFIDNQTGKEFADLATAESYVKVVHASPDAPGVDLLVNDQTAGTGLYFPNNTGYLTLPSGTKNIKVNVTGTATTVIDADLRFDAYQYYSVFAIDEVSNLSALVLNDNLTVPQPGNSHVRFLHLSPDAPAVDITLTDGTIIWGNVAFKESTDFTPLPSGTYDLQVRVAGTETVALELPGVSLADGEIYTVFAKGFLSGTNEQSLGAELIINNIVQ
jgi:hypothetical protein